MLWPVRQSRVIAEPDLSLSQNTTTSWYTYCYTWICIQQWVNLVEVFKFLVHWIINMRCIPLYIISLWEIPNLNELCWSNKLRGTWHTYPSIRSTQLISKHIIQNKLLKRSLDQCGFWWVFWFEAASTLACAHLLFLHGEQLTVPLITSRSSKENNDSLFPCRNEGLNDFLVTLCLTKFDLFTN